MTTDTEDTFMGLPVVDIDIDPKTIPSTWDYRVRSYSQPSNVPGVEPEAICEIVEVYYNADGDIVGWCQAGNPFADSIGNLQALLQTLTEAAGKPALSDEQLPDGGDDSDDESAG